LVLRFWEHNDPASSARQVARIVAARMMERLAAESSPNGTSRPI
jgi:hypothetical protein